MSSQPVFTNEQVAYMDNRITLKVREIIEQIHQAGMMYTEKTGAPIQGPKPTPAPTQPAQAAKPQTNNHLVTIESIRAILPEDLREKLTYEDAGSFYKIKPKSWLGGELFAEICGYFRPEGAEFVKAGKDSHWRINKQGGN